MANFTNAGKNGEALNKYGKLAVGVGIATAAAVGAAWANSRTRQAQVADGRTDSRTDGRTEPPGMIDWEKVRSTAHRMNNNETSTPEWRQHWNQYYSELVARAVPAIEEYAHTTIPRHLDT